MYVRNASGETGGALLRHYNVADAPRDPIQQLDRHFARKLAANEIRRYMRSVFRSELMAFREYRALADPVDRRKCARGQQGTRRDDCHAGEAAPALVGEPIQSHAANF
jgi:hypothetical protein